MHVISLIAKPDQLDPALVSSVQSAWGGGKANWLSPDEAAEFPVTTIPSNLIHVRAEIDPMGVDLNIIPMVGRQKKILIADMDSTMVEQECIDELAAEAGVGERVALITARAMNGELDFEAAIDERVGLLKGLPVGVIDKVLADRITLASGGQVLVSTMKAHGAHTALVSGGFTQFTSRIAEVLGFDSNRANTLLEAEGKLTGGVARPVLGREAKVEALNEVAERNGLSPSDAIAVGDGANDLGMLNHAGLGVALHAKPSVAAVAPVRISYGDLTSLLYLQGYSRADFVV